MQHKRNGQAVHLDGQAVTITEVHEPVSKVAVQYENGTSALVSFSDLTTEWTGATFREGDMVIANGNTADRYLVAIVGSEKALVLEMGDLDNFDPCGVLDELGCFIDSGFLFPLSALSLAPQVEAAGEDE
ncbi:MAG: hypothetical protein MOB07_31110 [Acidobacteria bacterium]|nr:hypothetical protein [Acidobacteriota bacterium]